MMPNDVEQHEFMDYFISSLVKIVFISFTHVLFTCLLTELPFGVKVLNCDDVQFSIFSIMYYVI